MNTCLTEQRQPVTMLKSLLADIDVSQEYVDTTISGMTLDSRRAKQGDLFIALKGETCDGRDYIDQALNQGASAVLCEAEGTEKSIEQNPRVIAVRSLRQQLGVLAEKFYQTARDDVRIIGITGTNGKTTCAHLIARSLEAMGVRCGVLGTIGNGFSDQLDDGQLTTMDVIGNHRTIRSLIDQGAEVIAMEVSSHGLDQGRVDDIQIEVAVFTNLTQDHLDYHGTMEAYADSKKKLFDLPSIESMVVNQDDEFGRQLIIDGEKRIEEIACLSYGMTNGMLKPENIAITTNGICFTLTHAGQTVEFNSPLVGRINVPNLLATIGTLLTMGYSLDAISNAIAIVEPIAGRMESFYNPSKDVLVVVDYSHTPDALQRALESLREHCQGALRVVFGCGGDRDQGKRSMMGEIAETYSDFSIVTDDNPRSEDPEKIVKEIIAGMKSIPTVIHDRKTAIATAISSANPQDCVLIAGKGHETTQTTGHDVKQFSDREVVAELTGGVV